MGVRPPGSDTISQTHQHARAMVSDPEGLIPHLGITNMDLSLTPAQAEIRESILKICARFGDDYWLARDTDGAFPHSFHKALAEAGWLGIAMPEAYGGAGLGITEAAVMMQAIAESGAAFSSASAVHMNIFGLNPVVMFGTDEQKRRFLSPLI